MLNKYLLLDSLFKFAIKCNIMWPLKMGRMGIHTQMQLQSFYLLKYVFLKKKGEVCLPGWSTHFPNVYLIFLKKQSSNYF